MRLNLALFSYTSIFRISFLLCLIINSRPSYSQNGSDKEGFVDKMLINMRIPCDGYDVNFQDKLKNNFTALWQNYSSKVENSNLGPSYFRPHPIGFIGENFQRLWVHFDTIYRVNDSIYSVAGKTKYSNSINLISGQLIIINSRNCYCSIDTSEKNMSFNKLVLLNGKYSINEFNSYGIIGKYTGLFYTFYNDSATLTSKIICKLNSDSYRNNQFFGSYRCINTNKLLTANWGDYRIPFSEKLDIGEGEFCPSEIYYKFGWYSYFNCYFSNENDKEACEAENIEWWKIN